MRTTPRCLEPEWLDTLPPDDPRALRSRRDLQRVNAWMLNAGIMTRALLGSRRGQPPRTLLDLGSGDGTFMLRVARRLAPHWPGVTAVLLDQQSIVSPETRRQFHSLGWTVEATSTDVFDFLERDAEFVRQRNHTGRVLHIVPAGNVQPRPAQFFAVMKYRKD